MPSPVEEIVEEDIRSDLEASFQEAAPEPSPAPEAAPPTSERDASGRFAPRVAAQPAAEQVPPQQEQQAAAPPAQEQQAAPPAQAPARAPVSWRPEEREGWERMDPRHQAAIMRREAEINTALQQTSQARRLAQEFSEAIQPYMGIIQAENATPIQAVKSLMNTAALLRTAAPQQKANLVAELVRNFNIPVEALDAALSATIRGQGVPADPLAPVLQAIDQRIAPLQSFVQQIQSRQQMAQQQMEATAHQTVEQFVADPQNEFAADVAEDMADILEMAARRNVQMSLQDAYNRATLLHPTIGKIIESRRASGGVAQQVAAAQQARNAAVSVRNDGAPSASSNNASDDGDIRSALAASIQTLGAQR